MTIKTSVRIAGVRAEIRTEHLPNTNSDNATAACSATIMMMMVMMIM
jgi:hypothetical protein